MSVPTRPTRPRTAARLLAAALLVLGAAACTDDDPERSVPSPEDTEGEPVTGVEDSDTVPDPDTGPEVEPEPDLQDPEGAEDEFIDMLDAYARTVIEGDPEALAATRSQGCAVVDTELDVPTTEPGTDPDDVGVSDVVVDIDDTDAVVSYTLDPLDERITDERWTREDGEWKWDSC